jgi:hypothetical protein
MLQRIGDKLYLHTKGLVRSTYSGQPHNILARLYGDAVLSRRDSEGALGNKS